MRVTNLRGPLGAGSLSQVVGLVTAGLLLLMPTGPATASSWEAELADGRRIHVDPTTNRPIVESKDGRERQLWDGVHRLDDGSTITVRSGIMVPNEEVSTLRRPEPSKPEAGADEEADAADASAEDTESCDQLVLKTCGLRQACEADESCRLSRQLRAMQLQAVGSNEDNLGWTEQRCREALGNDQEFPYCDQEPPLVTAACQELADHVCGATQRCAGSSSCLLARELLDLEGQAGAAEDAAQVERVRQQCHKVLVEHAFFPPCR